MRDLNFELKLLCLNCKEDSFVTQNDRLNVLQLIANQLHNLGFRRMSVNGLKPKHVFSLVEFWKKQGISVGTIKNRLAYIRWWARKVGKFDMLPETNAVLGVENRVYVTNQSKAVDGVSFEKALEFISDKHIRLSLELQAAFGLRREECLKFIPSWADRDTFIVLKGSWCKGGQQRFVPITNSYQRDVLDRARLLVGFSSMIPSNHTFIQQVKLYENLTLKVGLHKLHGLRHRYAQSRYFQLTGWLSPADGGPSKDSVLASSCLSDEQKQSWVKADLDARITISSELGHHRESITAVYLGR